MGDVLLNARFLMRPPTGVDRAATELIRAFLARLETPNVAALRPQGEIAMPEDRPASLLAITKASQSRLKSHLWEQWSLARTDPDSLLISLCNMGPVLRPRQIVMFHDAQVFREPEGYTRAFRTWYKAVQPRLGNRAARVLTVSEFSRAELIYFGLAPPENIHVLPNGADHILRIAADPDTLALHDLEPKQYFLVIGSLAPHKNLPFLISAAQQRRDTSMPLVIAGGGNAQVFGSVGIQQQRGVRVLGRVSDEALRALYDNARALLFPSLTEGFGLPAAEAMICGCPVIASTGGAIPEVCGDAAILLDPNDSHGWIAAMDSIAGSNDLYRTLSEKGLARARSLTWASSAKRLAEIVKDLC